MSYSLLFLEHLLVIAQGAPAAEAAPSFFEVFGLPIMMMITLYIVLMVLPQSRERKGRVAFINSLKKNDNVVTYGGIFGTIAGFSADGEQVTLRVDDNTRIRVRKSSIESVIKSEAEEKKSDDKPLK